MLMEFDWFYVNKMNQNLIIELCFGGFNCNLANIQGFRFALSGSYFFSVTVFSFDTRFDFW